MNTKDNQKPENSSPSSKKKYNPVPLSQVVYANIDDELATIYDQIQKKSKDHIYVIAPNRAVLFQSQINLKILKRKAQDLGKKISLVTTDKNGIYYAQKSKLDVYENIQDVTGKKKLNPKPVPPETLIQVTAKSDSTKEEIIEPEKEQKSRFSLVNFPELIENKYNNFIDSTKEYIYKKIPKLNPENQKFIITKPNKNLLFSIGLTSLLLFFFVAYISLPNSVVAITPNFIPLEQTVNITLADNEKHEKWLRTTTNKAIPMYKMSPGIIENTIEFQPTGFDLNGKNAEGEITIYNIADRDFPLIPFTRFQTDNGIIVRSKRFINLPPGSPENPSTAVVEVVADALDVNQIPIGDRGNLPSQTRLFIPGLRAETQQQVYAVVNDGLSGGVTSKDRIVTENDLVSAEQQALEKLRETYLVQLDEYIQKYNQDHSLDLKLFAFPETFRISEEQTNIDPNLLGQKMPSFNVTARAEVEAYAYDHEEFVDILVSQLKNIKSPDKQLTKIDTENIQIKILDTLDNQAIQTKLAEGFIEVTSTISGVEKYIVDPNTVSGEKLYQKISENVVNLRVEEAKKYVQGLPEIDSVQISTWPFWAPTLPNKPENIKIKLNDQI
jgi:hypothetical protein